MLITEALAIKITEVSVKSLADIFIGIGWKKISKLGSISDRKIQQIIFDASHKYIKNYTARHGYLKVLGMREPVALEKVYTNVRFLERWNIRQFESIENLEQAYRQNRSFQPKDTLDLIGLEVANGKQYLMVLGGPGVGKSTFLRKMGLEALKGYKGGYLHKCIPVFIDLKRFESKEIDIKQAIIKEFSICGFPDGEIATEKLLKSGKLLILLDGLDEVPGKVVPYVIDYIHDFCDKYDANRFIISCRTAAYNHNFLRFTDVAMAEFSNTQIKQFINNWFQSEADQKIGTAAKCWELLQKPENAGAKELANTPLLLTLLCLVYHRSQNFPNNRSVLYRKSLRLFLEEWAAERRIMRQAIYEGLNTEHQEILLSEIAHAGFEIDQLFFDKREVVDKIKTFLQDNLNAPNNLAGEQILNAIAIQQGILVERAEDVFSFSHLTLQEYLTAQYIVDNCQINKLNNYLTDRRWHEVFQLVAGLTRGGADELLLMMEAQAQNYINSSKLQGLLRWAQEVTTDNSEDYNLNAKRATALFLAIARDNILELVTLLSPKLSSIMEITCTLNFARAVNLNMARIISNTRTPRRKSTTTRTLSHAFSRTVVEELDNFKIFKDIEFKTIVENFKRLKNQAPSRYEPYKAHVGFNKRISNIWFRSLKLNAELVNLSSEELKALDNFIYINSLMVRCKQAAVRVSAKTWSEIENRMLLVEND
ncbi:MAG: NACHT domain-containing protein [Cyanobacteria bacterium J06635_10]